MIGNKLKLIMSGWRKLLCRLGIHRTYTQIHPSTKVPGWGMKVHICKHCGKWVKEDFWSDPDMYPGMIKEFQDNPPF